MGHNTMGSEIIPSTQEVTLTSKPSAPPPEYACEEDAVVANGVPIAACLPSREAKVQRLTAEFDLDYEIANDFFTAVLEGHTEVVVIALPLITSANNYMQDPFLAV